MKTKLIETLLEIELLALEVKKSHAANVIAMKARRAIEGATNNETRSEKTTYFVQFRSVYDPSHWQDWTSDGQLFTQSDAENVAAGLYSTNPSVRVVSRTVTETIIAP